MEDIFNIRLKPSNSNFINELKLVLFNTDKNELMYANHIAENIILIIYIN